MTERYVELHARSAFSFLEGSSTPEQLVARARELEMPRMALVDRNGFYGSPRFHMAGKYSGLKAHIGTEIDVEIFLDGRPVKAALLLLVKTREGYQNLCRLITKMKMRVPKNSPDCKVSLTELEEHSKGLICLTGGADGILAHSLKQGGDLSKTVSLLAQLKYIFGEDLGVELQRHFDRAEENRLQISASLAEKLRLPIVATNGVCFARREDRELADVFTCLRNHVKIQESGRLLEINSERHLKSPVEMEHLFRDLPAAIANTVEFSDRIEFLLNDLGYQFPSYPVPHGETMNSFLRKRTYEGARDRYDGKEGRPTLSRGLEQVDRELALIEKLDLAGYFLIVWDIVEFCRNNSIMVQGRGSAANSAVCYSLKITAVDPVGMELLFERFLSEGRGEYPDIDIDLPSGDQREKAIQHLYKKYTRLGAAMTANVITYRHRSAAREVGKVLGFKDETLERLSKMGMHFEWHDPSDTSERRFKKAGLNITHPLIKKYFELYQSIKDLPRHLGQHSGGMVICQGQLDSVVPIEPAAMEDRSIVQWDKDDCTDMGIIKVDLLGLGMMAVLEDTKALIEEHYDGEEIDFGKLPQDDEVYKELQQANTVGMFQIESRAQMATLPRLKPEKFYDLVVEVAIVRPGPIQGGMANPYIRRRQKKEPVESLHPLCEPFLKRTLGVALFQEQLLRIAMVCADFSGSEAEELRRAMGFKRSEERMKSISEKLRKGMEKKGIVGETQDKLVKAISSFALYGFPESHAASFALLAYASAYLKIKYLPAFTAAILNNQPMGFYHPFTLIKDAQRMGLRVKPIDINRSNYLCTIEHENDELLVRLGFKYVRGLRKQTGLAIEAERNEQPFASITDLRHRISEMRKNEFRHLAASGALNFIGAEGAEKRLINGAGAQTLDRRSALWEVTKAAQPVGELFAGLSEKDQVSPLEQMTLLERLNTDLNITGVTVGRHPLAQFRTELKKLGVKTAEELKKIRNGEYVKVAGSVIARQRPGTAKGFVFASIEDETGISNLVLEREIFERLSAVFVENDTLLAHGIIQNQDNVIHIRVKHLSAVETALQPIPARNFK